MKGFLFAIAAIIISLAVTGCKDQFDARTTGKMAGLAIYIGYTDALRNEYIGDDLEKRINNLWAEINTIESTSDLKAEAAKLEAAFNEVIACEKLPQIAKDNLTALRDMVMSRVYAVIDDKFTPDSEAVEFLLGVREGVNDQLNKVAADKKKEVKTDKVAEAPKAEEKTADKKATPAKSAKKVSDKKNNKSN